MPRIVHIEVKQLPVAYHSFDAPIGSEVRCPRCSATLEAEWRTVKEARSIFFRGVGEFAGIIVAMHIVLVGGLTAMAPADSRGDVLVVAVLLAVFSCFISTSFAAALVYFIGGTRIRVMRIGPISPQSYHIGLF